jgi:isoleucyl-tRNA synthetase
MGWFQSSYLVSKLRRNRAPFRAVMTHGFALDPVGAKMSKSKGNVVDPNNIVEQHGADVLRLWVASIDVQDDMRVGPKTFDSYAEVVRKFRNTFRYLLGAVDTQDYVRTDDLNAADDLDLYTLDRLGRTWMKCAEASSNYRFTDYQNTLYDFVLFLSQYFDARKDVLYCDAPNDPKRRAYIAVLGEVFDVLVPLSAPVLSFAADEAWRLRYNTCVHTERLHDYEPTLLDETTRGQVEGVLKLVSDLQPQFEQARRDGAVGSNEEAVLVGKLPAGLDPELLRALTKASEVREKSTKTTLTGLELVPAGELKLKKCGRCWRFYPKLNAAQQCERCETVEALLADSADRAEA